MAQKAVLALEDGTVFHGRGIGAEGESTGEVVFNTAMTGYQEILTDPSYARQLVTLTFPHIGNTGCNAVDAEAAQPMAAGLIIRDLPLQASSWRCEESLDAYLKRNGMVAIEAQACGAPVIATRIGAHPEIIRHAETGFLVDSVEVAVMLSARLDEIDSMACRRNVETRFTAAHMAEGYQRVYRSLIARGS